ncbi:MAG: hypothetical protein KAW47_07315 [Thermoplasmatales archaeon]|nr:hypothetical protein [Thermoplasmatales archaeon]
MKKIIGIFVCMLMITVVFSQSAIAKAVENVEIDHSVFYDSSSDNKVGVNCHVTYEGPAFCIFNVYMNKVGQSIFAVLTFLNSGSYEITMSIDDWEYTGSGVMRMVAYNGYYKYDNATDTFTFDGNAMLCFAKEL